MDIGQSILLSLLGYSPMYSSCCKVQQRALLVFIWAKILAVDSPCQQHLVRDQSQVFPDCAAGPSHAASAQVMASLFLSSVMQGYKQGQDEAVVGILISIFLNEDGGGHMPYALALCGTSMKRQG